MTVAELKKIWEPEAQGKIMNWKQVRASFPDRPLRLYGAGVDSGTYDYFTAAIVGKEHSSRGDFTASEDDNVLVQGIAGDINALGFFGLAYYLENKSKLKARAIKIEGRRRRRSSRRSRPRGTAATSRCRVRSSSTSARSRLIPSRRWRSSWNSTSTRSTQRSSSRRSATCRCRTTPMTCSRKRFKERQLGTAFHGSKIGVSIEDLLKAPLVN